MKPLAFDYDPAYVPPAPVIEIEIDGYHEALGKRSLWAMIDSGADATVIPLRLLKAIGAAYKETMWMRGVSGGRRDFDLYLVAIQIGTFRIRGLHVVAAPAGNEAIIGRDVLNQIVVTLDGPAAVTTIQSQ